MVTFEVGIEANAAKRKRRKTLAELVSSATKVTGIPITSEFIDYVFKDNKPKNAFSYMTKLFEEVRAADKHPVLILDELQKIGDVNMNGSLIYELFNFFIDLTKELHLCHVFVVTSDSIFIERVYSEAILPRRCEYLRVDDFDCGQTMGFLEGYGFDRLEKEIIWGGVGGKPVSLVKLINTKTSGKNIEDVIGSMFTLRTGEIESRLKIVKELGDELVVGDKHFDVNHEKLVSTLEMFANRDEVGADEIDEISKRYLVKENILFVDPLTKMIKPQSQLDLLAIRDVVA
ncbi:MAG: ATP-binding protein [Euryarchaeota archaeon]|nr:ATP-binding protein [Euryarchaeota archaeon]